MSGELVRVEKQDAILARVEKARALLAEARDATDAKKVADLARAAEIYAKRQKLSEEAIASATAIKIEAMALMGEMLKTAEKNTGTAGAGRPKLGGSQKEPPKDAPPTLADSGITKKESMHAQALAKVKESNPELYEKVRTGKASVAAAHVEARRQEKREELIEKAEEVEESHEEDAPPAWAILRGEVGLPQTPLRSLGEFARLVFADPPYNIGFDYGEGHDDSQPAGEYLAWCGEWMAECVRHLAGDGSMWVLINDEYAAEFNITLRRLGLTVRNWIIWYESFGVNCTDKFNRTKRHLFYCVRDPKNFVFNFDAVSRPSDRQAKYNDARANPAGKVLDDVWFDVPRLTGTAAERIPDFPTQLPLALLRRIVACCSEPGDLVLDPFCGSGTTGAAALELGRRFVGVERSSKFAELATLRLKGVRRG